ncbi:MAG: large repetitive protein, partial [Thermoleophilaceae bacterium]|nr:large repetitive protein [Thermoleophilaceae bacterium]
WIAGTGLEQNARTLVSTRGLDDVAIADIDSDGCNDVVGAGDYGRGRVHLGDGQGNFDGGRDLQQIGYVNDGSFATRVTMAISDLNGDAKPDLVISDQLSNKVMVFSNTSTTAGPPCHDEPPQAVGDQATVTEDSGPTDTGVLGNDVNSDGGPKTVASVIQPSHGTAAITGGGTGASYQPAANYCGPDSFTYTLNGGSSATVSLTVTCVDDQPVAANDSTTVDQGSAAAAIDVLANDTDSDGGPKLVASATPPAHGTVSITGGGTGLTYQPNAGYCGSDTFTYTLNGGSVGTVSVSVACAPPPPRTCADPGTIAALVGTAGDDVLVGTAGRDVISGRGGDDCIFGRSGDDRLDGGTGADLIRGSTGSDRMNGSAGNDKVDGGTGNDTITPGSGKDRVIAGGGNDEISARDGARDTIDCGAGKDKVTADRTDKVNSNCENVKRAERRRR